MRYDLDDPRLTAYALGELDDETERAALEAHLKTDPEASRFVDEIRATAELLTKQLRAEAGPALADSHRKAIDEMLKPRPRVPFYAYGIAASLFLALTVGLLLPTIQSARESSRRTSGTVAMAPLDVRIWERSPTPDATRPMRGMELADARRPETEAALVEGLRSQDAPESPPTPLAAGEALSDRLETFAFKEAETAGKPVESRLGTVAAITTRSPKAAPPAAAPARGIESLALRARRATREAIVAPATGDALADGSVRFNKKGGMRGGGGGLPGGAPQQLEARAYHNENRFGRLAEKGQAAPTPVAALAEVAGAVPVEEEQVRLQAESLVKARKDVADNFGIEPAQQPPPAPMPPAEFNREAFNPIVENDFIRVLEEPQSTFSIDVDTASYAIVRRYLMDQSILPPRDAVRIEELVNYFKYDYPQPKGDDPFSVNVEIARCPWNADHRLARIGLKGREIEQARRPSSNIVFLVDVSGSMNEPDKLPLLKDGLRMLANELGENDRVAIVVYAGSEGLALDSTNGQKKAEILRVIDEMRPGGSTHASAGIQLAYDIAGRNFIPGGVNRVILATDGDFNVGVTDDGALQTLIAEKAKSKVFLTVLGFGRGNLQDAKMEGLADKGNGNYHYIDTPREAHKVLVEEAGGNLVTIAKDVKIQVNFNPVKVGAYRLLGYENRKLANQDFKDDTKDAGEIGAGHTVTALYELVPAGRESKIAAADRPKFVKPAEPADPDAKESFQVSLRFKKPEGDVSEQRDYPVTDEGRDYAQATDDFKFAAAVTSFGLVLRDSKYKAEANLDATLELAEASKGSDPGGYRAEFLEIVRKAKALTPR
jgi:Ca-activated chloride channel family protein